MIRLITVIGHGVDLLPHFIKHYQQYVDEIHIGVYETELHPLLGNQVNEIVENYNNVKIVKIDDYIQKISNILSFENSIRFKELKKPFTWNDIAYISNLPANRIL